MEVIPALAAWVVTAACRYEPVANSAVGSNLCSGLSGLHLSSGAHTYRAGSDGYRRATARWNHKDAPHPDWIVVPKTEQDVAATVSPPLDNVFYLCFSEWEKTDDANLGSICQRQGYAFPCSQWRPWSHELAWQNG